MAKPIITLNGLKIVIMLGMLVVILSGIRFAADIIVPFILAFIYCSRSQSRCATDDPMPNSARYRSIIAHCDYCYVNGTATGLFGDIIK